MTTAAYVASSVAVQAQPSPGGGILARVDRLDIMLSYLEELRGSRSSSTTSAAAASGNSGAVTTSEVSNFSVDSSPRSADWSRCRPIGAVVVETQVKGNLMDRIEYLEKRLLKLEEAIESEEKKARSEGEEMKRRNVEKAKRERGKGLKRLVASCVKGERETQ